MEMGPVADPQASIRWSERVGITAATDLWRERAAAAFGLSFHGFNSLGASTVAHVFLEDGPSGSLLLRLRRQDDGELLLECVAFGTVRASDDEVRKLRREALRALNDGDALDIDQALSTAERDARRPPIPRVEVWDPEFARSGKGTTRGKEYRHHPIRRDVRWKRVRKGLDRLVVKGAEPWWIRERAPTLLELEVVHRRAGARSDATSDALAQAVSDLLREIVNGFAQEAQGILLRIVLALDERYITQDGVSLDLHKLSLTERRTLAGREFRGRRAVRGEAIRSTYEPAGLDRLAVNLLRMEVEMTGSFVPTSQALATDPAQVLIYLPRERVPITGTWIECRVDGSILRGREVALSEGEPFPPSRFDAYGWRSDSISTGKARAPTEGG
jgi:hypothetical protein